MNSLYGNYRNRKFTDIYPDADSFVTFEKNCGIAPSVSDANLTKLYYLLYARYGNSVIASFDENQFSYKMASIIFNEGPIWQKKLAVQAELQTLSLEDAQISAKNIGNHAFNPGEGYDLDSDGILQTINDQNVSTQKISPVVAAQLILQSLADVTTSFINRFENLFLKFVEPELPLWYTSEE